MEAGARADQGNPRDSRWASRSSRGKRAAAPDKLDGGSRSSSAVDPRCPEPRVSAGKTAVEERSFAALRPAIAAAPTFRPAATRLRMEELADCSRCESSL